MRTPYVVAAIGMIAFTACAKSPRTSTVSAGIPSGAPAAVVAALAPGGVLRVALPQNPPLFDTTDPSTKQPAGIGVSLAKALASKLGVRYTIVTYPSPDLVAASATSGSWDVGVTAVSPPAAMMLDFAAPLVQLPHTLLVRVRSAITSIAQADRAGVRIASERGSPHTSRLQAMLKHATVVLVDDDRAGIAMLRSGAVDAFAGPRSAFDQVVKTMDGLRIVAGDFFIPTFALGTPKGRDAAVLAFLTTFIEDAKASGLLQQAIAGTGLHDVDLAASTTTGS